VPKVVPIRNKYENVRALLAAIAEEPRMVGFVGTIVLDDRTHIPVCHGTHCGDLAFAGVMLCRLSQEVDDDDDVTLGRG
jgi:hypothetical protein